MVICLERGADLNMVQVMPLPLTVSCFSKMQIGFTFLVPSYPGSPGQRAGKRACVCQIALNGVKCAKGCLYAEKLLIHLAASVRCRLIKAGPQRQRISHYAKAQCNKSSLLLN